MRLHLRVDSPYRLMIEKKTAQAYPKTGQTQVYLAKRAATAGGQLDTGRTSSRDAELVYRYFLRSVGPAGHSSMSSGSLQRPSTPCGRCNVQAQHHNRPAGGAIFPPTNNQRPPASQTTWQTLGQSPPHFDTTTVHARSRRRRISSPARQPSTGRPDRTTD